MDPLNAALEAQKQKFQDRGTEHPKPSGGGPGLPNERDINPNSNHLDVSENSQYLKKLRELPNLGSFFINLQSFTPVRNYLIKNNGHRLGQIACSFASDLVGRKIPDCEFGVTKSILKQGIRLRFRQKISWDRFLYLDIEISNQAGLLGIVVSKASLNNLPSFPLLSAGLFSIFATYICYAMGGFFFLNIPPPLENLRAWNPETQTFTERSISSPAESNSILIFTIWAVLLIIIFFTSFKSSENNEKNMDHTANQRGLIQQRTQFVFSQIDNLLKGIPTDDISIEDLEDSNPGHVIPRRGWR